MMLHLFEPNWGNQSIIVQGILNTSIKCRKGPGINIAWPEEGLSFAITLDKELESEYVWINKIFLLLLQLVMPK
ncbi:hypothetical protein [Paraglaciecola arctica]|uniref:Uncharacterized protein n=1 Tax=Paraglaciecola arctica BSs20135 TaxID=493475 RepID=K6XBJ2_9ALTE|nr:hypothetical protein [Paraglaciecola arctica]GAC17994.1 hypothetical protein GARC_1013 [Paraglaciecola arctica BSs20135]